MKRRQDSSKDRRNKNAIVQCPTCAKAMKSDKLNRHLATHNENKICRYCKHEIREDMKYCVKIKSMKNIVIELMAYMNMLKVIQTVVQ